MSLRRGSIVTAALVLVGLVAAWRASRPRAEVRAVEQRVSSPVIEDHPETVAGRTRAPDHASEVRIGVSSAPELDTPAVADSRLDQRAVVIVVDDVQHPVAGAKVRSKPTLAPDEWAATLGTTDAAGRIEVPLDRAAGACLRADASGLTSGWIRVSELVLSPQEERIVPLLRKAIVSGVVLAANDAALPNATVSFQLESQTLGRPFADAPLAVAADAAGKFEVEVDATGATFRVRAADGADASNVASVQPEPGARIELTLRIDDVLRIRGVVRASDGSPRPGAHVCIRSLESATPPARRIAKSRDVDASAAFEYQPDEPGSFEVFAYGAGLASSKVEVVVLDAGHKSADLLLTLADPGAITGRVVLPDGTPVAGAQLIALHEWCRACTNGVRLPGERFGLLQATSDATGAFELEPTLVSEHLYTVRCFPRAERKRSAIDLSDLPGDAMNVEIVASDEALRGGVLEGTVRFADTRELAAQLSMQLYQLRGDSWQQVPLREFASHDGRFHLESLPIGGRYAATIDGIDGRLPVLVPAFTAAREPVTVDLQMVRATRLELTALDGAGAPLVRRRVDLVPDEWHPGYEGCLLSITNGAGAAAFGVWPGHYRVVIAGVDSDTPSMDVQLGTGVQFVQLRLP